MRSLSRADVARLFEIPDDIVDALIASGRLLCHLVDGEARVPLTQLEAFFREGLIRVYRAEVEVQQAPVARAYEPVAPMRTAAREPEPEPEPEREPEPEPEPPPRADLRETPPPARRAAAPPTPPEPPREPEPEAADEGEDRSDRPDYRAQPRYVPRRQIDGIFGETKFTIVQLSSTGLRIRHDDPVTPGDEAKLSFALMTPTARSFVVRARVVWTSLARYGESDRTFWISGIRVTEHVDRLARAIDILKTAHDLQPERRESPRLQAAAPEDLSSLSGVSDEDVALVIKAIQRFSSDPHEASRWYGRGRFALADAQVRRDAPTKPRDREEVLAIWEYLERQVEIAKIVDVLAWTRSSKRVG